MIFFAHFFSFEFYDVSFVTDIICKQVAVGQISHGASNEKGLIVVYIHLLRLEVFFK
jgi:hypothetical protein